MATPQVFVICGNNCKYEGMTKEQIHTAIAQAVETGTIGNCDAGFITTIKTINGKALQFFWGTQAEYDALSEEQKQTVYAIINNDPTIDNIKRAIEELQETQKRVVEIENNRPDYLYGLAEGNARLIKSPEFDINTLCNTSDCGNYVFHFAAFANGGGVNFPDGIIRSDITAARLTVEADLLDSGYTTIYHTLKISMYSNNHDKILVFYRAYHKFTNSWDPWKRYISEEELTNSTFSRLQKYEEIGNIKGYTAYDFSKGSILTYRARNGETPMLGASITYNTINDEYMVYDTAAKVCKVLDLDINIGPFKTIPGTWCYMCKIREEPDDYGTIQEVWLIQRVD